MKALSTVMLAALVLAACTRLPAPPPAIAPPTASVPDSPISTSQPAYGRTDGTYAVPGWVGG